MLMVVFLLSGCNLKGGDPVVTTTGKVPLPVEEKTVQLVWEASSGIVQGYKIEASLDNAKFVELGIVNGTGVTISGLISKKTYYFRVRSFNQGGNSPYTAVSSLQL